MPSLLNVIYLSYKKDGSKGWYVVSEHLACLAAPLKICHNHSYVSHIYYTNTAEPDLHHWHAAVSPVLPKMSGFALYQIS